MCWVCGQGGAYRPQAFSAEAISIADGSAFQSSLADIGQDASFVATANASTAEIEALTGYGIYRWNSLVSAGTPTIVTYSFPTGPASYEGGLTGYSAFSEEQKGYARMALDAWASASGLTFVEVPASVGGRIRFSFVNMDSSTAGYAYYPSESYDQAGNVYLSTSRFQSAGWLTAPGTFGFEVLLHEIGHAIGFKHPFQGFPTLDPAKDNNQYTVMSYTRAGVTSVIGSIDRAAVQYFYGINDLNYSWNSSMLTFSIYGADIGESTVGTELTDFIYGAGGNDIIYGMAGNDTLFGGPGGDRLDGGMGIDTVSYAQESGAVTVYLNTAFTGGQAAGDTLLNIENVIGTAYADTLTGDYWDNLLIGGGNADILSGDFGNDILVGDGPVLWDNNGAAIRRLYIATLNRAPDDAGHRDWYRSLQGGQDLTSTAGGFIASQEFANVYGSLSNAAFVSTLYNNVLGRAADAQGLNDWVNLLNGGMSRASVVVGFSESLEFQISSDILAHSGQVYRIYDSAFNRQADAGGLEGWVNAMYAGAKIGDLVNGFMNSAEFTNTYGPINALSNTDFVNLLYTNVLNRTADSGGLASWVASLDGGTSRANVFLSFSESQEHKNLMAPGYDSFMRSALPTWKDTLMGSWGNDTLFGGRGSDTFVFAVTASSSDVILGFESIDTLRFIGFRYSNASQALAKMTQSGNDVVFSDQGNTITFQNTQLATLQGMTSAGWVFA
jgi:Ca2+-binding RTX toxin-like protein